MERRLGGDHRPLVRGVLDQPLGLQPPQRFTHRYPADAEPLRQRLLLQLHADAERTSEDQISQRAQVPPSGLRG